MDIKKLALATAVFGALGGLYGCSGDEDATITIDDNSVTTTTTTSTTTTGGTDNTGFFDDQDAIDASVAAIDGASTRQVVRLNPETGLEVAVTAVQLPASIMADVTLDSDVLYFLNSRVTVGNGNEEMTATDGVLVSGDPLAEVTLTIEAGTQIVGNSDTFANLLITRGSEIMAMGTAAEPIVFSSDDTDMDGSGEWGGLILQGFGRTNLCAYPEDDGTSAPVACNFDGEGESDFAGGHDNSDSSGVLNYVVVAEGGFEFAVGNEINGISFLSVGSGTEVDFIQVHNNADDGVEFYGGAVNVSHVVLTGNQDESIDWDEGYVGNIQFALVIQDEGSDHAIEADTLGNPGFLSAPTVVNATFLGAGDGFAELHRLKDTTGGFIHNSVLTSVSGMPLDVCVALEDADTLTNAMNDAIAYNNIIADCTTFETSDGVASMLLDIDTVTLTPGLVDTTTYSSAATAATGLTVIDFVAFDMTHSESLASQAGDFFEDTTYAGAVEPGAPSLWFADWTIEGSL